MKRFSEKMISEAKDKVGNDRALCALSGGVDSAVAATLVNRAIEKKLTCVFVDIGLMRKGEVDEIKKPSDNTRR